MKCQLPILTALFALLACGDSAAQQVPRARRDTPSTTLSSQSSQSSAKANRLVADAARRMWELPSVEAKIRQRVSMYGHQLVGAGSYRQFISANNVHLMRLELKLTIAEQVTSILQVCDGQYMWIRRDIPNGKSLDSIDLGRVRHAIEDSDKTLLVEPAANWMMLGGLSKLLRSISSNFAFDSARAGQIHGLPVWEVRGHWRPERLAEIAPQVQDGAPLPERLPHQVALILGRDDQLPLFPYRIDYLREVPGDGAGGGQKGLESIAAMELFEVRRHEEMDVSQFRYDAGNQEISDQTDVYLRSLGLIE